MYLLITAIVGVIFFLYGAYNFVRALIARDSILTQITPIRISVSGILMVFHQPITSTLSAKYLEFFTEHGYEFGSVFAAWGGILTLIVIQCLVLPSWRALVVGDLAQSMARR